MTNRREFIAGTAATTGLLVGGCQSTNRVSKAKKSVDYNAGSNICDSVNCFIGTGGHGHTYPGATLPFGSVQLSPDTSNNRWDSCSGYHQDDDSIMGFSHTHLSGTGIGDMLDVLLVPQSGTPKLVPGSLEDPDSGYRSRFRDESEVATPGYYAVELTDSQIKAELSVTKRAGIHRYRFPDGKPKSVLIDLVHGQKDWWTDQVEPRIENAQIRVLDDQTIVGGRQVFQWARGRWIFFALKFSRPFTTKTLYNDNQPQSNEQLVTEGKFLKALLEFDKNDDSPLLVKVGISAVDAEGALRNLDSEIKGFDFDWVKTQARVAWEKELSGIQFEGGNPTQRAIFSTAHYHALLAPTLFSDIDGRYRGMDNAIHHLRRGEENYSTYSLWDTYRALHPFLTITQSERVPGILNGLIRMGKESPKGAPIWPLQGRETDTMIGYHSASVLAEGVRKIPGLDIQTAYKFIRKRAFDDDVHGFGFYRSMNYIPADQVDESVSRTLEFAYCDWAASKIADAAGATEDAQILRERSKYYRNVFDESIGFVRGKNEDGTWVTPFKPDSLGHNQARWRDFTESNSWQATFLNQHDIYNYMTLFGGEAGFEKKLDQLFSASSEMTDGHLDDISGLVGQYAHGNEPSHHVAYLYAYSGSHYKTQHRVRMLCDQMYFNDYDGLSGNEDCGQMSAWYLMSAIGFYAVDPSSGIYVFGSPLFPKTSIDVGGNKRLDIIAEGVSESAYYIQSVFLNGKPYQKSYIVHEDIVAGGELKFIMGNKPNYDFGSEQSSRPPSFV